MARLPKSMSSTPEEDRFFEKEKAAQAEETETEPVEEVVEEAEPVEEVAAEPAEGEQPAEEEPTAETPDAEAPEGRRVPIGELYAEHEKRKELQAKITQLEGTFSRVMERLNQQQPQQPTQPQYQAPEVPDYAVDPVAHLKAKLDQLEYSAGSHGQVLAQQNVLNQFTTALAGLENQFRTQTPDYDEAVSFAKQARDSELAALGYDPAQRVELLRQEIVGTSAAAMQRGQNPAEVFYQYAKVRGWQKPGAGNGQRPVAKQASASDKLATVARAQATTRSLPRGGSAPPAAITLESLANMEDTEFDKSFDKFWRKT